MSHCLHVHDRISTFDLLYDVEHGFGRSLPSLSGPLRLVVVFHQYVGNGGRDSSGTYVVAVTVNSTLHKYVVRSRTPDATPQKCRPESPSTPSTRSTRTRSTPSRSHPHERDTARDAGETSEAIPLSHLGRTNWAGQTTASEGLGVPVVRLDGRGEQIHGRVPRGEHPRVVYTVDREARNRRNRLAVASTVIPHRPRRC